MKNRCDVSLTAKNCSSAGFTLAEIAVVIVIAGILLATFAGSLTMYMNKAENKAVKTNMDTIQQALEEFYNGTGRFPCPARMALGPDQANFGQEISIVDAGPPQTTTCDAGFVAVNDIARIGAGATSVWVGALPVRSLNLPDQYAQDSWGNRYTYAVTMRQATYPGNPAFPGYVNNGGRIAVIDSANQNILSIPGTADYVVVSHGQDGAGAFSNQGVPGVACPVAPAAMQRENCDVVTSAAPAAACNGGLAPCVMYRKTTLTTTNNAGNNYFDDYVVFRAGSVGATSIQAVPSGAVVAFNSPNCPTGWQPFTAADGRFILAAGNLPAQAYVGGPYDPPPHNWGDAGGQEVVRLTQNNMPAHSHRVESGGAPTTIVGAAGANTTTVVSGSGAPGGAAMLTDQVGGGTDVDIMPPHIVLTYCEKE